MFKEPAQHRDFLSKDKISGAVFLRKFIRVFDFIFVVRHYR